jgi:hypothetical protein
MPNWFASQPIVRQQLAQNALPLASSLLFLMLNGAWNIKTELKKGLMKEKSQKLRLTAALFGIALVSAPVLAMEAQTDASTEATLQAQSTAQSQTQIDNQVKSDSSLTVETTTQVQNPHFETEVSVSVELDLELNREGGNGVSTEIDVAIATDLLKAELAAELQANARPELPERPEKPEVAGQVAAAVQIILEEAAAERQAFLEAQSEALAESRGKAAIERENLRNELQEVREAWLAIQKNTGIEMRTRLEELRAELQNSIELEVVLASAREEARQRRGQD